ncbi:bridging integrator 3-like isoform X1 [Zootermopsis nevadensis]|uniref:bridging integrator 3-like isoform X1 n=1 Tax=Zootermopsis nevadensis TaxID=136037 RepID=UPI000B8E69E1|nr:bridging integrator 3-like isoform X1 [Zootermopsis nevadensis]
MTWNPLRRNYLSTKPSPAPLVLAKIDERNLEIVFQRLQNIEETTRRLQKDMKKYLENVASVIKSEQKITTDLSGSALCHQNAELRKLVEDYHSVTSQLYNSARDLSSVNQRTFLEPLKKYGGIFNSVDSAFQRREQLLQEWRNLAAKVHKLEERERTASNVVKLEREKKSLEVSAKELVTCHAFLLSELTQFLEKRISYFHPTLQALLRSQLEYYGNTTRLFTHLVLGTNAKEGSPSSLSVSDSEFEASINSKLIRIRALSIVKT